MSYNYVRGANNYDAAYVLADTQSVTADVGGKDSGGTAIYLDLNNNQGSEWVAHLRYTAVDFTTGDETYTVAIQTSDSSTFASGIVTEKSFDMGIAATGSAQTYLNIGGFSQKRRYVRVYFDVGGTTPILTVDKVWISPRD
jgi:hypothetical protein